MYEKSSFPYWMCHWCAFQLTAINLGVWKPHHLFHDFYKPFLKLIIPYKYVKWFHNKFSSHHPESCVPKNYTSMVIDWECSRLTKKDATLNARETLEKYYPQLNSKILPILDKLKL